MTDPDTERARSWTSESGPTILQGREGTMRKLIVGIDVGGTKVAGGLVTQRGRLVKSFIVPTRAEKGFKRSYSQIAHVIEHLIRLAGGRHKVGGIGICAPGPLNPKTGLVINPPNLPG